MDAVDLLEKRIEALELQILPKDKSVLSNKSQTIADLLTETQTMISSALSCRESVTSLLQHMHTINEYLDPSSGEYDLEADIKKQYLLQIYPELKARVELIKTFNNLIQFTNSESLQKVTELSGKLQTLAGSNVEIYEECKEVNENVLKALQEYNNISTTIKVLFTQMDKDISQFEYTQNIKISTE